MALLAVRLDELTPLLSGRSELKSRHLQLETVTDTFEVACQGHNHSIERRIFEIISLENGFYFTRLTVKEPVLRLASLSPN